MITKQKTHDALNGCLKIIAVFGLCAICGISGYTAGFATHFRLQFAVNTTAISGEAYCETNKKVAILTGALQSETVMKSSELQPGKKDRQ